MYINSHYQLGLSLSVLGFSSMGLYYLGPIASPPFALGVYMFSIFLKKGREEMPAHPLFNIPPPPILFSQEAFRIINIQPPGAFVSQNQLRIH